MIKHKDIPAALKHLDSLKNIDAIAAHMRELNIKAVVASCPDCAVARYLFVTVGDALDISVLPGDSRAYTPRGTVRWRRLDDRGDTLTVMPSKVDQFARDFDLGRYPELTTK